MTSEEQALADKIGSTAVKLIGDGRALYIYRKIWTYSLCIGDVKNEGYFTDLWCYETLPLAMAAMLAWNPLDISTPEPEGWHRHPPTGRRRPDGDASREYVNL